MPPPSDHQVAVTPVPDTRQEPRVAYSVREVAELCGVSYWVAARWVRKELIKSIDMAGCRLVPVAELARLFPFDTTSPPEPRSATG